MTAPYMRYFLIGRAAWRWLKSGAGREGAIMATLALVLFASNWARLTINLQPMPWVSAFVVLTGAAMMVSVALDWSPPRSLSLLGRASYSL